MLTDDDRKPYVLVLAPKHIIVSVQMRAEFDRIAAPLFDHVNENGHVLVKTVEGRGETPVTVVFQHWLTIRPLEERVRRVAEAEVAS